MRENLKKSIVIKIAIGSEDTLIHKAERPSNYFSNSHIIRLREKGVISVQILLEIHLTEHSRVHFQG